MPAAEMRSARSSSIPRLPCPIAAPAERGAEQPEPAAIQPIASACALSVSATFMASRSRETALPFGAVSTPRGPPAPARTTAPRQDDAGRCGRAPRRRAGALRHHRANPIGRAAGTRRIGMGDIWASTRCRASSQARRRSARATGASATGPWRILAAGRRRFGKAGRPVWRGFLNRVPGQTWAHGPSRTPSQPVPRSTPCVAPCRRPRPRLESGRQVDSPGLDAGATALCAAIAMLPPDSARPMLPALGSLARGSGRLGAALTLALTTPPSLAGGRG